jgi:hypothetical protein
VARGEGGCDAVHPHGLLEEAQLLPYRLLAFEDGSDRVDAGDLQQEPCAGYAEDAVGSGRASRSRVEGPASAERKKERPEEQQAQDEVPTYQHKGVSAVKRGEQHPRSERRQSRMPSDAQGERQGGRSHEERRLEGQRSIHPMEGPGTLRQRTGDLDREDAEVRVVRLQVERTVAEVGEQQGRHPDPQCRQASHIDSEELGGSRHQPHSHTLQPIRSRHRGTG